MNESDTKTRLLQALRFFPVSIIPNMFHNPRHLVILSRRMNGRSCSTFLKVMVFQKITEKIFHFDTTVSVKHNINFTFSPSTLRNLI